MFCFSELVLKDGKAQEGNGECFEIDVEFLGIFGFTPENSNVVEIGELCGGDDVFLAWLAVSQANDLRLSL